MANITRLEKSKIVLNKLLTEKGWKSVGYSGSGIYFKNGFYFVISKPEKSAIMNQQLNRDVIVGFEEMIHCNAAYHLEKDGFLICSGKFKNFVSDTYTYNYSSEFLEKTLGFIDEIEAYTAMSDLEIIKYKKREIITSTSNQNFLQRTSDSIGQTKTFIFDKSSNEEASKLLKHASVYFINGRRPNEFYIIPFKSDFSGLDEAHGFFISIALLSQLEASGSIQPVRINSNQDIEYSHISITKYGCELDDSFADFNLSTAQKSILSTALEMGLNFTPLLDNSLSLEQDMAILELMKNGENCKALIGKNLPAEHLQFLVKLSENSLPLTAFLQESSLQMLQKKYSGFSETIDVRLSSIPRITQNSKEIARKIAFDLRDFSHVLEDSSKLHLQLLDESLGEYSVLSKCILNYGIEDINSAKVSWVSLPEDLKRIILSYYTAPVEINGKSWDTYLADNYNKILSLFYLGDNKYYLQFPYFFIGFDYDSVFIMDFSNQLLWRGLLINGKAYYYISDSNSVNNIL